MTVLRTELTGRRRYRKNGYDLNAEQDEVLVLQVEVAEFFSAREDQPAKWVCRWRDATVEDVQKEELV